MATLVTFRAPSPVKITNATYKKGVWSVNLGYMAFTVISLVPLPVMTARVIDRMVHAFHVNLDGLD